MGSEDHIIKLYDYIENPQDQTVSELIDQFGIYAFAWERDALIIESTVFDYAQFMLSVEDGFYLFHDHRYEDPKAICAMGSPFEQTERLFLDWLKDLEPDVMRPRKAVIGNLTEEVRMTSSTGAQKGSKMCQIGDVPPEALEELGRIAGFGAEKYDKYNYLKGYDYNLSYNAAQRHMMAWWGGEDLDPESGMSHLMHAAWHMAALYAHVKRGIGTDDRPTQEYIESLIERSKND